MEFQARPFQKVPNDILHEIFIHCLPNDHWLIGLLPLDAPVLLTHICQRWRNVALDSPTLWKCLRWDIGVAHPLDERQLNIFATAAARARSSPRNLQIIIRRRIPSFQETPRTPIAHLPNISSRLFLPSAPSLTRLLLRGVPIDLIHAIPEGSFPHLSRLALHLDGEDLAAFPWEILGPLKAFSGTPALRRVALGSSPFYDREPETSMVDNLLLPWEQVSHALDFTPKDKRPLFDYLSRCEQLRYLFLEIVDDEIIDQHTNESSNTCTVKTLANLEGITLYYLDTISGAISYPAIFDAFEFPNLKALRLDGGDFDFQNPGEWTGPIAHRFLSKIGRLSRLTYLSLCPMSIDPRSLRQIILATPHVKTLDAFIHENYENLFEGIVWDTEDRVLPNLETLILELDNTIADDEGEGESIPPEPFEAFLNSRLRHDSPFRKVVVYSSRSPQTGGEPEEFARIATKYVARGLAFERRVVQKQRSRKLNHLWVERDPELYDWPEVSETHS